MLVLRLFCTLAASIQLTMLCFQMWTRPVHRRLGKPPKHVRCHECRHVNSTAATFSVFPCEYMHSSEYAQVLAEVRNYKPKFLYTRNIPECWLERAVSSEYRGGFD